MTAHDAFRFFRPFAARRSRHGAAMAPFLLTCAVGAAGLLPAGSVRAQPQPALASTPVHLSLPAQSLARTLAALSRQFGISIGGEAGLLDGRQAPALNGALTLEQALRHALEGSGLVAVRSGASAMTVVRGSDAVTTLPAVTVTARADALGGERPPAYAGGLVARGGGLGLLGDTDFMDTPFNVVSYTAQAVEDQLPRSVASFLARNDASVRVVGGEGDSTDTLRIRGFDLATDEIAFNGLPGLLAQYRSAAEFMDRIEVLKGPGAMLSGMSPSGAAGGAVNILTKRADDAPLTRLTTSYFSDSRIGLHADVGRRFGADGEFGVRVNGVLRRGDTARDHQDEQMGMGAVALDYRGQRLRASLDYVKQSHRGHAVRTVLSSFAVAPGVSLPAPAGSTNFGQPWSYLRSGDETLAARVEYDLADDATAYAAIGRSRGWHGGIGGNIYLMSADGDTTQNAAASAFDLHTTSAEAGVRGRLRTGPVSHRWALSANTLKRDVAYGFSTSVATFESNIYDPVIYPQPDGIPGVAAQPASQTRLRSIGFADTLGFVDDRILLTLGLRHQQVKVQNFPATAGQYDESAVTPLAGIVVKPWDNVSLYANYVEGLAQGGTAPDGVANAGQVLKPLKTRQAEVGIKRDWGRLATSVSLFQIRKPSGLLDPATNRYEANGEQRHRGVELNAWGEVTPGLRMLGGLAWMDAEMTRTNSAATTGKDPVGVPRMTANVGLEWDVPTLAGVTLTAAAIHTGSVYADGTNATRVSGWTRFDFGARWATRVMDRNVTFRAMLENAFDKRYWTIGTWQSAYLGLPRAVVLSATIDF